MSGISPKNDNDPRNDATKPPDTGRRRSTRRQRVRDYEQQALANPDPLAANLGATSAGLMRIEYRLLDATYRALARSPAALEDFVSLLPAVVVCTQVARQIQRFAEIETRLRGAATVTGLGRPAPPRLPAAEALPGTEGDR